MSRHKLLILLLYVAIVAVATLALVRVAGFYMSTTIDEHYARQRLERLQKVRLSEIRRIYIAGGVHDEPPMSACLEGDRDREDIAQLLAALKKIQVSDRAVRVPAIQERIVIMGEKERHLATIYGYFDPRRAPVISPTMRSQDVSRIVKDIVKRKGEKIPKWQQNKRTKEWEYK